MSGTVTIEVRTPADPDPLRTLNTPMESATDVVFALMSLGGKREAIERVLLTDDSSIHVTYTDDATGRSGTVVWA